MKLAVLSDIHADVHALQDALVQIGQIRVERVVCCGDLVDYGRFPEETLTLLRERGVEAIRGNHDRWAVASGSDMSGGRLTANSVAFLESMPTYRRKLVDGQRVVLAHARPDSDMNGIAPDALEHELFELLEDVECARKFT